MTERKTFDLYKSGCVVDLSIGTWLASTRLDPKDLGLKASSTTHRDTLIWLGRKRLVRKGDMKSIRKVKNRATLHLYSNSFAFPFGQCQFVTFKKLDKMIEIMNECEHDFWVEVDAFLENYDRIRSEVLLEYADLFMKILKEHNGMTDEEMEKERDRLVANLNTKYPLKTEIRGKFRFDFVVFEVASPKFKSLTMRGAKDAAKTDEIFRERLEMKVDGFLDGVMGQLKGMAVEMVDYMGKRLDSNKVNFKTVGAFQRYVETFKEMNFSGWDIQSRMEELSHKLAGLDADAMKDSLVKRTLSDAVAELKKEIVGTTNDEILDGYRLLNMDTDASDPVEPEEPTETRSLMV